MSLRSIFKKFMSIFKKAEYETLAFNKYALIRKQKSRVDPLVSKYETIGLLCPHCKIELCETRRECKIKCHYCGQKMERYYSLLKCEVFRERHGYPIEESKKEIKNEKVQ